MKPNLGTLDRIIRVIAAIAIAILFFTGQISGIFGIVLLVLALVFVVTSIINYCPLYIIFGFNTKGNKV